MLDRKNSTQKDQISFFLIDIFCSAIIRQRVFYTHTHTHTHTHIHIYISKEITFCFLGKRYCQCLKKHGSDLKFDIHLPKGG